MRRHKPKGFLVLLTALFLVAGFAAAASALTAAGTTITNNVTVNYKVDDVDQTAVTAQADFVVDEKVDLTVAWQDGSAVAVTPGSTQNALHFVVENAGNKTRHFSLEVVQVVDGAQAATTDKVDSFDMMTDSFSYYKEEGTTVGFQSGEDTLINDFSDLSLAAAASIDVYVLAKAPLGIANGAYASVHLVTTAVDDSGNALTATDGAWAKDTEQIVLADGVGSDANDTQYDASHSAQGDYVVSTASLTVTKDVSVFEDPINGLASVPGNNPKAIPGATLLYTITITNAAGAGESATSVTVIDTVPDNTKFVVGSITGGTACDYSNSNVDTWTYSPTGTTDENVKHIKVTADDLAAGGSVEITFQVEIL